MQDLPNGGGRRSKHWPPGAGDPRYATAQYSTRLGDIQNDKSLSIFYRGFTVTVLVCLR